MYQCIPCSYEWNNLDHAMTCKIYFCDINENEHKNEINEYKRDFHLFNVYYYAPSHSLTLT